MRILKTLSMLVVLAGISGMALAQFTSPIVYRATAPTGACTSRLIYQTIGTGVLTNCQNGTWATISAIGSSYTVASLSVTAGNLATITHNLGTKSVNVSLIDHTTGAAVSVAWTAATINTVTFTPTATQTLDGIVISSVAAGGASTLQSPVLVQGTAAGCVSLFELPANGANFGKTCAPDSITTDWTILGLAAPATGFRYLTNSSGTMTESLVSSTGSGVVVLATAPTFVTDIRTPLIIGGTAAGSSITYQSTTGAGTAGGIAHQWTGGTNGATVIATCLNNGNCGFGTTGPGSKFEVAQAVNTLGSVFSTGFVASTVSYGGINIRTTDATNYLAAKIYITGGATAASRYLTIETLGDNGASTYGNVVLNPTSGNVGIGTTGPGAKLHAAGNALIGPGTGALTCTGTLCVLDSVASTGNVAIHIGYDGSGGYATTHTPALTTYVGIVAGQTQGTTHLFDITNNTGTAQTYIDAAYDLTIVGQKSTTGVRYLCIDTAGKITSSSAACVGT